MKEVVAQKEHNSLRLDKFLKIITKSAHSGICRAVREKRVKINGNLAKISDKVAENDRIEYDLYSKNKESGSVIPKNLENIIRKSIIFENKNLVAINKPYGFIVQKAKKNDIAIIDILKQIYDKSIHIVHRLDKETSGMMIFAKNLPYARIVSKQFHDRVIRKTYIAVLSGIPEENTGIIKSYIEKIPSNESIAFQNNENYNSETNFLVLDKNYEKNISLVEFKPKTGRIHQIRLHACKISNGIFGDKKYNKTYKNGQKLHLFSYEIKFDDISLKCKEIPERILQTMRLCDLFHTNDII